MNSSKIKIKNDIKSCLTDKFNIKDIDCNKKRTFTPEGWNYQDVWLEQSSKDSPLVTCDYDMDMAIASERTGRLTQSDMDKKIQDLQIKIQNLENKDTDVQVGGKERNKLYKLYQYYLTDK